MQPDVYAKRLRIHPPLSTSVKRGYNMSIFQTITSAAMNPFVFLQS